MKRMHSRMKAAVVSLGLYAVFVLVAQMQITYV